MNSIQAIYYLPSLGQQISFSIVRLEIQKTEPANMPSFEGEREVHLPLSDTFPKALRRMTFFLLSRAVPAITHKGTVAREYVLVPLMDLIEAQILRLKRFLFYSYMLFEFFHDSLL
jgi:hypothetical protein